MIKQGSDSRKGGDGERIFEGLGVSAGIAIGTAHVHRSDGFAVPEYRVADSRLDAERERFTGAVKKARRELVALRAKSRSLPAAAAEELGYLLDAYQHMLAGSRLIRGVEDRIAHQRINAEAALQAEIHAITAGFLAMNDSYLARRADDICGVGNRVMHNLLGEPARRLPTRLLRGSVIIADEITPADTALMDPRVVVGFAASAGGAEGHTAIMARALGLPAVLGVPDLAARVHGGEKVIVDGDAGRVVIDPTNETLALFERRLAERQREVRALQKLKKRPSVTRDGVAVTLQANVELPLEIGQVLQMGASGIGLLRSEFQFMNRDDPPGEEEQYETLHCIVDAMGGRPVTVRTLDVGGEKIASSLVDTIGSSASSPLGLRGIRLSLNRVDLFRSQINAILRAGAHGPVRILLPMVTTVGEVRRARQMVTRAAVQLRRRGVAIADPLPPVGVMIEVPGAALSADALAQCADFFAIGSNDLTMYALAIDRSDDRVAYLYNPLHPAVLRLIQFSAAAAQRAAIPVSLCGEMAGDPRYAALLLGLGIRDLSMSAYNIGRVKQRIRQMDMAAATARAGLILDQTDAGRIATLLDDFNALA